MLDLLKSMDSWCYLFLIGGVLAGLSASVIGNGRDKKQRLLIVKFNREEPAGKALTGQPAQIMNGRIKPLMLTVGMILCLVAYIMLLIASGIPVFIASEPLRGGLFLLPIILLLATILLSLRTFFTKLVIYSNAIIVQAPLQRKTYFFDDFESFEACVYADRQISYRAFHVNKTKGVLKLWLRKQAHFQMVQNVFKNNVRVSEIITDRLDTPHYARIKELQNA